MKKFSEIDSLNEELFGMFKSKPKDTDYIKVSKKLIEFYTKNLISGDFLTVQSEEKKNFDFDYYKVICIERTEESNFLVEIETFDKMRQSLGNLEYGMTI